MHYFITVIHHLHVTGLWLAGHLLDEYNDAMLCVIKHIKIDLMMMMMMMTHKLLLSGVQVFNSSNTHYLEMTDDWQTGRG